MKTRNGILAGVLLAAALQASSFASGMLIPKDRSVPPLGVKYQRVDIRIKDGVATARMEQVFINSTSRDLEAIYLFPLPKDASIADFAMYINGRRVSGELVEKGKARRIYEDIVRRMRDPGLLEHMGGNLFRVRVFPVPKQGEQKIELTYSQALAFESGLYKLVYPLRTKEEATRTLEDFTVSVRLMSSIPIRNIYSPTHKVGITRKGDREAVLGFEEERGLLDRDFTLYYSVSKKDFGLNLLTHRPGGEDGFFTMMLSPTVVPKGDLAVNKDIAFVFDTSGSMSGEKIRQAREALEYCVRNLNAGDRFTVIRFSTDVEPFSESLVRASEDNKTKALEFIGRIAAKGGTNINDALARALAMDYDRRRPGIVVFLTDGKPTIGESNADTIVGNVKSGNKGGKRIFVFGVGNGVNTHLLDKISGQNGGLSQYVRPEEDIEVKVSSFSDKISHPVLGRPVVGIDRVKILQMHPRSLPDLFCGDQITVFGRYRGDGHVAIRLTGEVNGRQREFVYEGTFPKRNADNEFIPRLWATRRVGYLLDEIRLHGEDRELKDEVIRLSRAYGIMTPYTSYLVLESDEEYARQGIPREYKGKEIRSKKEPWLGMHRPPPAPSAAPPAEKPSRAWARKRDELGGADDKAALPIFGGGGEEEKLAYGLRKDGKKARLTAATESEVGEFLREKSGAGAVELSDAIRRYRERDVAKDESSGVRHIGKKIFYFINGVWVDREYKKEMRSTSVTFGSSEYFKLLSEKPQLKRYLTLGRKVIVCLEKDSAIIVE